MIDPIKIEKTEAAAWKDMIDAAPPAFRKTSGLRYENIGHGLAINFQKIPIPLFNRVIGLSEVTQESIDAIKSFYRHGEKYLVHFHNGMQPANATNLLSANGYGTTGKWERVVRDNKSIQAEPAIDIEVHEVNEGLTENWVKFLCDTYTFDFYEWPRAFARRAGWRHYIAMRHNSTIACRSFFMTAESTVFSGVDAPVPGVMTSDCTGDFAIWNKAIADHLLLGATLFVADIEMPEREKNKAAYDGFAKLGFEIPYTRVHYSPQRK